MDFEEINRRSHEFMDSYMSDPDFLDQQYAVPSMRELVDQPGVVGVARFVEFPSFDPERLFTLVYRPDSIEVSAVVGATSLWCSNPQVHWVSVEDGPKEIEVSEGDPFDA